MFGGFLLAVMLITRYWYPIEGLHRYDFIFLAAIAFQVMLLLFKLETLREALVIVVFHLVATVMELFKTSDAIGAWVYPEAYVFGIGNVPLFTGFMYSAVGSYLARVWRLFDFQYSYYPPKWATVVLVTLVYQLFQPSFYLGYSLAAVGCDHRHVLSHHHLLSGDLAASQHAAACWLVLGGDVYLVRGKYCHLCQHLDLP